jgi:hypothetical protein
MDPMTENVTPVFLRNIFFEAGHIEYHALYRGDD